MAKKRTLKANLQKAQARVKVLEQRVIALTKTLDRLSQIKVEDVVPDRKYKELRMPLDDDDKLASEVLFKRVKIFPPIGFLIGKITEVDNGMLVEFVKK